MAKLTNRQLDVLAARVVDLLEEAHKVDADKVKESDEYKNFEQYYTDEYTPILSEISENAAYVKKILEPLKIQLYQIKERLPDLYFNIYAPQENTNLLEQYLNRKKREKFQASYFDREKTLRRVEADIILSDVANPEELVNSLVEKLK